ncbi:MAG: mechanosensitive ion channel protein MscS [Chlamydiae bacterium CG10_big_fil_rev_8_21_14_0_10_35_9]|nr:MAG: mechanosensitive ion channel protein MscS [Chlamydiae bacterium CG10_big_fil_rev_8_21_14_0_10_35_9]
MESENLEPWWEQLIPLSYGWVIEVFIIIFLSLILSYIATRFYKKAYPRLQKTHRPWDDALLKALIVPLKGFIWFIGFIVAVHMIAWHAEDKSYVQVVSGLREIGIIILFVWFLVRFIRQIELNLAKPRPGKRKLDETTIRAIIQLLRLSVLITAGLILMQEFGIPVSGIVAFGGAGGVAVGFAAKDLLANFFGALMIFLDRPFAIGDWVRSPDRNIEGTVEHISWRLTRIRTFDKRPLYVPNSVFLNISIENPSRMHNRRILTNIGLRYKDAGKVQAIVKEVEEMLKNHPEIDTSKTLFVHVVNFGASSIDFQIYTFTKTTNWIHFQAVQQDVFLKTLDIIHQKGAEIAVPERTVNLVGEYSEKR